MQQPWLVTATLSGFNSSKIIKFVTYPGYVRSLTFSVEYPFLKQNLVYLLFCSLLFSIFIKNIIIMFHDLYKRRYEGVCRYHIINFCQLRDPFPVMKLQPPSPHTHTQCTQINNQDYKIIYRNKFGIYP